MKKQIKDRLTEVVSFIVCLIIIYAVVINTGILKGFQPIDFDTAFAQIKGVFNGELKSDTNPTSVGSQRDIAKIWNYQPNRIPDSVISTIAILLILITESKVIFWIVALHLL